MRTDNGEVRHVHLTVAQHAHAGDTVPATGIGIPRLAAEALVYLLDYHVDARQLKTEDILAPLFKRLGHDGVVGVRHGADGDIPRLLP